MTTATERLKNLEANQAERFAAVAYLKKVDNLQNEGGDGYSSYDEACRVIYDETQADIVKARQEAFVEEWTLEVFTARCKTWNEIMTALKTAEAQHAAKTKTEQQLGFTCAALLKAKAMLGVK